MKYFTQFLMLCNLMAIVVLVVAGERGRSIEEIFQRLDRNGDGKITRDELKRKRAFERLDLDKNGEITLDEARKAAAGRGDKKEKEDDNDADAPSQAPKVEGMKKHLNVPYNKAEGVDPKLLSVDIYTSAEPENCPVMVYVHGGGWKVGDKSRVQSKADFFVSEGYVFISVNYRLVPAVEFPANIQDVADALAWIETNAQKYGGDPDWIFLMGHSAGAHLAALAGTDGSRLKKAGKDLSLLKAVIPLDTNGYDIADLMKQGKGSAISKTYEQAFGSDPEVWKAASPSTHVARDKNIPPFLIFVANNPRKLERSKEFQKLLQDHGVRAELVHVPEHDHVGINHSVGVPGEKTTVEIKKFLDSIMCQFHVAYVHPGKTSQATAVLDLNDDGMLDLVVAAKHRAYVILNKGGGEFADGGTLRTDNVNGWGMHDLNRDGRIDIFAAQQERGDNDSWISDGKGGFKRVDMGNETLGCARNVVFADFDGDGFTDSFHGVSSFGTNHSGCELHPGKADGTFGPDVIEEVLDPPVPGFWYAEAKHPERGKEKWANKMIKGALVRDFDGDGRPDLVAGAYSDRGFQEDEFAFKWVDSQERGLFIFHNKSEKGKIRFSEVALEAVGENAHGAAKKYWNVYSIVPLDYDRDGDLDLFVGAVVRPAGRGEKEDTDAARFFENVSEPGKIKFRDATKDAGLAYLNDADPRRRAFRSLASGAPVDFDSDGWTDIVLVNRRDADKTPYNYVHIFRNTGKKGFVEVSRQRHGLGSGSGGRDLCVADLDNDGRVDVVVNDGTVGGFDGLDNTRIYLNRVQNDNNWIKLDAASEKNGSPAVGAKVTLYKAGTKEILGHDEVRSDFCYRSKRPFTLHFGLAGVESVDVQVLTRKGVKKTFPGLKAGTRHSLDLAEKTGKNWK